MVSIGSKALPSRRRRTCGFMEDSLMGEENVLYKRGKGKKGMNRKYSRERHGFDGDNSNRNVSGRMSDRSMTAGKSSKYQSTSASQTTLVRYFDLPYNCDFFVSLLLLFFCFNKFFAILDFSEW
jgi:hypothetical protein